LNATGPLSGVGELPLLSIGVQCTMVHPDESGMPDHGIHAAIFGIRATHRGRRIIASSESGLVGETGLPDMVCHMVQSFILI
jgi:hypothetical protein